MHLFSKELGLKDAISHATSNSMNKAVKPDKEVEVELMG